MRNVSMDGLRFSDAALSNRVLLLSSLNDINIYVEDVGKEYEYEEIFERLFNDEIEIFSIFPLGGKDAVLAEFHQKGGQDSDGKINVYIVDGDFDVLWEDQKEESPYLIYLKRYNIENYYCTKNAVIKFMRSYLKCTRIIAENTICYDEWRNNVCRRIGELFILFAVVKRYCPDMPNVQLGIGEFIDENGCLIDDALSRYYTRVKARISNVDILMSEVNERIRMQFDGTYDEGVYSITCGKYQMESICRHLKRCCRKNINREQFRNRLISNFDLTPLLFLKERITMLFATDSTLIANIAPEAV